MTTDATRIATIVLRIATIVLDDAIASAMRRRRAAGLEADAWGQAMIARGDRAADDGDTALLAILAAECRGEPRIEDGFGEPCEGRR